MLSGKSYPFQYSRSSGYRPQEGPTRLLFLFVWGLLVSILGVCSAGHSAAESCYLGDIQRYFADDESPK